MIVVDRAAPLLTVQDRGRFGFLADGVTRSGPLDPLAFSVANALVGNGRGAAMFEACHGGARLVIETDTIFAVTGGAQELNLDGVEVAPYTAHAAKAGSVLTVAHPTRGAVWYASFRGGLDTPLVLGSRATLVSAELGGRAIRNGDQFSIGAEASAPPVTRPVPSMLRETVPTDALPLCAAPRADALDASQWEAFFGVNFTVSRAVSRVGYRLEGPRFESRLPADLASEPACAGAMQLPPEGNPIVLMADHPTIGGYPVIGVVAAHALGRLAQCFPGASVRFRSASEAEARAALAAELNALSKWASAE